MTELYVNSVYKYLHSIAEKPCMEFKTSSFIKEELLKFGYKVKDGFAETAVIGILDSGEEGNVLAIRADMDALEFEMDGKKVNIHACGHDANSSGEDFHFYTQLLDVKASYVGLGADLKPGLHNPEMNFDIKALNNGKEILKKIVHKRLG